MLNKVEKIKHYTNKIKPCKPLEHTAEKIKHHEVKLSIVGKTISKKVR